MRTVGTETFVARGAEQRRRIAEAPAMTENECLLPNYTRFGIFDLIDTGCFNLNARAYPLDNVIGAPKEEKTDAKGWIAHMSS